MSEADKIRELLKETRDVLSPVAHSGSNITINAGGVALWAAVTGCLVVAAITITGAIFVAVGIADLNRQTQELRQRDDLLQAYIATTPPEPEK